MQDAIHLEAGRSAVIEAERGSFILDTTFVLFFLAVDLGNSLSASFLDMALPLATLGTFVVVPYFLPCEGERPAFIKWVAGRSFLALFGFLAGLLFSRSIGPVFPEYFTHLPMTLLIVSAIASCYLQLYGIIRLRLAR